MSTNISSSNFESFEAVSGRLRVIASCDHCRYRKIKCATQAGEAKCDACARFSVECTYHARSKYYTDREKVVANHMAGGSGSVSTLTGSLNSGSSMITFSPAAPAGVHAATSSCYRSNTHTTPDTEPSMPPAALMPYFIELFFKHHAASLPFMCYETVVAGYLQSSLSALTSNAIACLAVKYSQEMKELSSVDPNTSSEYYATQTKNILYGMIQYPSIDVLGGLVIIAFHEHASGRIDGLTYYAHQSAQMVRIMGLQDDATVASISHSMECYQQIISLRNIVSQLYQLVAAK